MTNSADRDQLASLDLHCLQRQSIIIRVQYDKGQLFTFLIIF